MIANTSPAGSIFALKQFGWKDKTEVDQNIKANVSVTVSEIQELKRRAALDHEPK